MVSLNLNTTIVILKLFPLYFSIISLPDLNTTIVILKQEEYDLMQELYLNLNTTIVILKHNFFTRSKYFMDI